MERLSMKKLRESTLIPLASAVSLAILSHMESTMTWFCSMFSGLAEFLTNISPALLYFPWRISW